MFSHMDSIAEAKIHILYLVNKVPGVTYHQLMDSCMKSLYVDFFDFASAYEELINGNLMNRTGSVPGQEDSLGSTDILTLTVGGKAVLNDLVDAINDKFRMTLDEIAAGLKSEHENSQRIITTKAPKNGGYEVDLSYKGEGGTINVKLFAETNDIADTMIRNWRSKCMTFTDDISRQLLSNS